MAPKKPNHSSLSLEEERNHSSSEEQIYPSDSDELSDSDSGDKSEPSPAKSKRPPPAPAPIVKETKKSKKNTVTVDPRKPISSKSAKKSGGSKSAKASPASNGKKNGATDEESKKQLFQRLWSEEDEIVLLQGIIDFKENAVTNPDAFHDFIRESLHIVVSRAQLVDKIRKLKKKFVNNSRKGKDGKVYELSTLIWGSNSGGAENNKSRSKPNGVDDSIVEGRWIYPDLLGLNGVENSDKEKVERKIDISRFVQYGGRNDSFILSEEIVKAGMELVEDSKRVGLEVKWKTLMEKELGLYVERMELLKEQAKLVLEAVKASGN